MIASDGSPIKPVNVTSVNTLAGKLFKGINIYNSHKSYDFRKNFKDNKVEKITYKLEMFY